MQTYESCLELLNKTVKVHSLKGGVYNQVIGSLVFVSENEGSLAVALISDDKESALQTKIGIICTYAIKNPRCRFKRIVDNDVDVSFIPLISTIEIVNKMAKHSLMNDPYSKGPEGETMGPSGLSWL